MPLATLSNGDDDGSENVVKNKMNLRFFFKLHRVYYLDPLNISSAGDLS